MPRQRVKPKVQYLGNNTEVGEDGYIVVQPANGLAITHREPPRYSMHVINEGNTAVLFQVAKWDNHEDHPDYPNPPCPPPTFLSYDTFSIPPGADGVIIGGLNPDTYLHNGLDDGVLSREIRVDVNGLLSVGYLEWV